MSNEILDALSEAFEPEDNVALATVSEVLPEGITLIFDGQEQASEKKYKGNTSISLAAGNRVKLTRISGTWLIDYKIGVPGVNAHELPAGGTSGQVLVKNGSAAYAVKWADSNGIPTGGTAGQVLAKKNNANFNVEWKTPESSSDQLKSGTYSVSLTSTGILTPGRTAVAIGSYSSKFGDLYANGTVQLGNSYGSIGFFGANPTKKKTLTTSSSLSDVIAALRAYGLG